MPSFPEGQCSSIPSPRRLDPAPAPTLCIVMPMSRRPCAQLQPLSRSSQAGRHMPDKSSEKQRRLFLGIGGRLLRRFTIATSHTYVYRQDDDTSSRTQQTRAISHTYRLVGNVDASLSRTPPIVAVHRTHMLTPNDDDTSEHYPPPMRSLRGGSHATDN